MEHLKNWFVATRPWSFTMTIISVSVGSALAAREGPFSWGIYFLAVTGAVLMHAGTNLMNDYYDTRYGVDTEQAATTQYRPHVIVHGLIPARQVLAGAYASFGAAALIGIYLTVTCGWTVLLIGIAGIIAGIGYTAPPMKYKYLALGEVSVFLMWGPLMVEGGYFVQRGMLGSGALLVSVPFGVLVALVLFANNIRDIEHDQGRHIRTIAILLGPRAGIHTYLGMMLFAYASTLAIALSGVITMWALLVFLSLPLALKLLREMEAGIPADADARTAKLDTAFGILCGGARHQGLTG
jgi:1,4-dihydroxy-2-naphthoate octaprenyltransferase